MTWDFGFTGDEITESCDSKARQDLPEGTHAFTIKKADHGDVGKLGPCLKLELAPEAAGFWWVKCNIQHGAKGAKLAHSLCRAVGIDPSGPVSLDADQLVGVKVSARVWHKRGTDRVFVNVGEFHKSEPVVETAEATSKAPAKRTAAQKIAGDRGDIPF